MDKNAERAQRLTITVTSLLNYTAISKQDADNYDAVVSEIKQALDNAENSGFEKAIKTAADLMRQKCMNAECEERCFHQHLILFLLNGPK
jgi:hypothetical protein